MRTMCVSLALVIAVASTAFSVQNAGPAWNSFAALHQFDLYPVGEGETFAEHYHGSNLPGDFAAIMNNVSHAMGASVGSGYDDLMNASLENWPDHSR